MKTISLFQTMSLQPPTPPILIRQLSIHETIPVEKQVTTITYNVLPDRPVKKRKILLQSAEQLSDDVKTTIQNVVFQDETAGDAAHAVAVKKLNSLGDSTPSVPLGDFLSRPVLIRTINWDMTDVVNATMDTFAPWELFFNDPVITKKLDNYAFIRCNLKLKFLINASPFYYGMLQASYLPLPNYGTNTIDHTYGTPLIPISQRQKVIITPQNNQGGEMTLPFLFHKNWLALGDQTRSNWFGDIVMSIYAQLQSANGTTGTSLDIQVFAWADDVEVMGPTDELAMQSAEVDSALLSSKDEYSGMISRPASAIASAANLLGEIPIIGPYMTASSIVASAVGEVAHLFGYTNVPNMSNQSAFKSQPFPQFASPEVSVPTERLCIDPKNELCIDNKVHGSSSEDQLAINHFLQKESYLTTLTYATTDTPGKALFASRVCPGLHHTTVNGAIYSYDLTPMYYASGMFKYWRGDIIFRFKIIASQYHKGRIRINFSPTGDISTTTNSSLLTTTFSRIVDIGTEDDIEIIVPYMQATPWLDNYTIAATDLDNFRWSNAGGTLTAVEGKDNGTITCKVMTKLTAPVASSNIKILVYVRGGNNLEVALPHDIEQSLTHLQLQSEEISVDVAGSKAGVAHPCRYLVNMGEKITSLRQIMRRKTFVGSIPFLNVTTGDFVTNVFEMNTYPKFYGYDANGHSNAAETLGVGDYRFNFVTNTPTAWISRCFVGHRGSMTWDLNLDTTSTGIACSHFSAIRNSEPQATLGSGYYAVQTNIANNSDLARGQLFSSRSGCGGTSLTNQNTQTGLSVNVPDYNKYKFHFTTAETRTVGAAYDDSDVNGIKIHANTRNVLGGATSSKQLCIETYAGIGPDYTCIHFLNIPTFYKLQVPATAT